MNVRMVVTVALLVFVAAAVAAIVMQSVDRSPAADAAEPAQDSVADGIVAYYIHGDLRCATCRKLEAYSREAIEGGFPDGSLPWQAVNTDRPEHAHFISDFELTTKALVLVEYEDGAVKRWQDLKLIWQLVGEKDAFLKYVRDGARDFKANA